MNHDELLSLIAVTLANPIAQGIVAEWADDEQPAAQPESE